MNSRHVLSDLFQVEKGAKSTRTADGRVLSGHWKDIQNQRKFFDEIATRLNVRNHDDWYNVSFKQIVELGGSGLLKRYNGSHIKALQTVYPDVDWKVWKFSNVPSGYWTSLENQRQFFRDIQNELNVKKPEDWYQVSTQQVQQIGGHAVLAHYDGSLIKALQALFPEVTWDVWKFENVAKSKGFWDDAQNQKQFFVYIQKDLNIQKPEDWYTVTVQQVNKLGGSAVLAKHGGSLVKALQASFPETKWKPWDFAGVTKGFWANMENQRTFFLHLEKQLNIEKLEDWYNISVQQVQKLGGSGLLTAHYKGSLIRALRKIFPERDWKLWKFKRVSRGHWNEVDNRRQFLLELGKKMKITNKTDWNYLTLKDFVNAGGFHFYHKFPSFGKMLKETLPEFSLSANVINYRLTHKREYLLANIVRDLFHGHWMTTNYSHPDILFRESNRHGQLDAYLPDLAIAFEYQGEHHYGHSVLERDDTANVQSRDDQKRSACLRLGITLVEVPYWWDASREQIQAMIHDKRPDLVAESFYHKPRVVMDKPLQPGRVAPLDDYVLTKSIGYPKCRGCEKVIEPNTLRIAARATNVRVTQQFKVQICLDPKCIKLALNYQTKWCKLPEFKSIIKVPISLPCIPTDNSVTKIYWLTIDCLTYQAFNSKS